MKDLKKIAALILSATMVLGIAACGGTPSSSQTAPTEPAVTQPAATEPAATEPAATEPAATEAPTTEEATVPASESAAPETEAPAAETEAPETEAPAAETPAAETPAAETPAAETPAAETPAVETEPAEPETEAPAAEPAGDGPFTVTFNLNYEGAPEPTVTTVEKGKTVKAPRKSNKSVKAVSPDEKYSYEYEKANFNAWYTEPECINEYDFKTPVNSNLELYAGYDATTYAFEAELTDLSGKTGFGYSISYNDEQMIRYDSPERNQSARMGFSVGYLYAEGLSLEFLIYSDRDVEDVTLKARLSAEFRDIYIAPEQVTLNDNTYYPFQFYVNDEPAEYEPIALTGAKAQMTPNQRPYDEYTISKNISLKEGLNEIVLYVDNSHEFESTVNAVAPMVDTIYLTTDATLTWEPKWENLEKVLYEDN
ncbi:MAG: InlB B-repeat-containing protein [Lachnospiraceae bacterium]|nr:InlB B-repeat-containing protein [Lachnospiraceae bacterium]